MRVGTAPNRLSLLAIAALAMPSLLLFSGCGSSSSSDSSDEQGPPRGVVTVDFQKPVGEEDQIGEELLVASETKAVASALAKTSSSRTR